MTYRSSAEHAAEAVRNGADETGDLACTDHGSAKLEAWLRELVDQQQATIRQKDAELRAAEERLRADDRQKGLLVQFDKMTALLPSPEPTPEDPKGWLSRLFGQRP